jgi:outer membrane protein assembly factor BamB
MRNLGGIAVVLALLAAVGAAIGLVRGGLPFRADTASIAGEGTAKSEGSSPVAFKPASTSKEAFWPQWRGPNSDGIATEKFSTDWPADGLPEVWKAPIGIGFSSMAIADGRLFTMGWKDDAETVFCFDSLTGEEKWKHTYSGKKIDNLHDGGPGATPTIDGERVYTLGREGQLYCLAAKSGDVAWQRSLPKETGVEVPEWGFTSSPLIHKNHVIVDGGRLIAFDKLSGEPVWQTEKFRPGYGSAVAFERGGRQLVAVFNNDCLLVVAAADGEEVAQYPWQSSYATTSTTPLIDGDTIFVSSGYGRGCALLKWQDDALEPVYDNKVMANHFNNSVLYEGHLYGIHGNTHSNRNGKITCMDHATGKEAWSQRGYGVGSLLIADGKCLILSDEGELVACKASPEGYEELAKAKILDGLCWTVPVLAGGHVYARNAAGDLVCVRMPSK